MIELQVKDEELFNKLIPHSTYYSNITKVVVLPDNKRYLIPLEQKINSKSNNACLDFKKDIIINNADDCIKYYLGLFNPKLFTVSFKSLDKINILIENNFLSCSKNFKDAFSELDGYSTINELLCSRHKYRINRKNQGFENIINLNLQDIFSDVEISEKQVHTVNCKILDKYFETDRFNKKRFTIYGQYSSFETGEKNINFSFYGRTNNIENLVSSYETLTILLDDKMNFKSILPKNLNISKEIIVSPSKDIKKELEGLPVVLFRMAYYEYILRTKILRKKTLNNFQSDVHELDMGDTGIFDIHICSVSTIDNNKLLLSDKFNITIDDIYPGKWEILYTPEQGFILGAKHFIDDFLNVYNSNFDPIQEILPFLNKNNNDEFSEYDKSVEYLDSCLVADIKVINNNSVVIFKNKHNMTDKRFDKIADAYDSPYGLIRINKIDKDAVAINLPWKQTKVEFVETFFGSLCAVIFKENIIPLEDKLIRTIKETVRNEFDKRNEHEKKKK